MPDYPLPKFHFQVQWGGTKIGFTEVTGLEVTTEKIEYRDGASKEYHKTRMPGMQTFGDLTIKSKPLIIGVLTRQPLGFLDYLFLAFLVACFLVLMEHESG